MGPICHSSDNWRSTMADNRPPRPRPEDIRFGDQAKIAERQAAFKRFITKYFTPPEGPIFVADEANMFDISSDTTEEILAKIKKIYGLELTVNDLRRPIWHLLDLLERPV